jgi:hypothetical protein
MAGDDFEYDEEHEDEQVHTALQPSAAGADSSSDDDGDGWMEQLPDATVYLADAEPASSASAGGDSDSDSESEAYASANVMFDNSEFEPAYSPPRPANSPPRQRVTIDLRWATHPPRMS